MLVEGADGLAVVKRGSAASIRREAHLLARLAHPAAVPLRDVSEDPPALLLGWMQGGTLADRIGDLGGDALVSVIDAILDVLACAHARGIVHRDLKPSNILFAADGAPCLADFDIAFDAGLPAERPAGSLPYVAPEQVRGEAGPRADLFALAASVWHVTTGRPPFGGSLNTRFVSGPPPFDPIVPVPATLESWLVRLLQPDPQRRPRSAAHARHALLGTVPSVGLPAPVPTAAVPAALAEAARIEVVGRQSALARLWQALETAPGNVLVEAEAGAGRTTLLDELAFRAGVSGRAFVLRASCESGVDGLFEALARLPGVALHPDAPYGSLFERAAVAAQALREASEGDAILLVLDDAHHGAVTLDAVRSLTALDLPLLVVASAERETLAARPVESGLLQDFVRVFIEPVKPVAVVETPPSPALAIAALLGPVARSVWEEACANAEVDAVVSRGVWLDEANRIRLRSDRLRRVVLQTGVTAALQRACADALLDTGSTAPRNRLRALQLRLAAGDPVQDELVDCLHDLLDRADIPVAAHALGGIRDAEERAVLQCRIAWARGDTDAARSTLPERGRSARLALARARLAVLDGDLRRAEALWEALPDTHTRSLGLGMVRIRRGALDSGASLLEPVFASGRPLDRLRASFGLANVAVQQDRLDDARDYVNEARTIATEVGARRQLAECGTYLGEIERRARRPDRALAPLEQAWKALVPIDLEEAMVARCNLGLALVECGRDGRAHLRAVRKWAVDTDVPLIIVACNSGLCAAGVPDGGAHLDEIEGIVEATGYREADVVQLLKRAGRSGMPWAPQAAALAAMLAG